METDAVRLDRLLKGLRRQAGVTKRALSRATGVHEHDLGRAHLEREDVQRRLCHALRRQNLPVLAAQLGLDRDGCLALESFSREVFVVYSGHDPPGPVPEYLTAAQVLYLGEVGLEHFQRDEFQLAAPVLQEAWEQLARCPPSPEHRDFSACLRIGTNLAGLYAYQGELAAARQIFAHLMPLADRYPDHGPDRRIQDHRALALKGAAILQRHLGEDPLRVLATAQRSYGLMVGHRINRIGQAALQRDQAKPLVGAGLGWTPSAERLLAPYSRVRALLESAEALLTSLEPTDRNLEELLFTRLTRIECFAALNHNEEVLRHWDAMHAPDWIPSLLEKHAGAPLDSKYRLAEVAYLLVRGAWDDVASRASELERALENTLYRDRLERAREIRRAADRQDRKAALRVLIR